MVLLALRCIVTDHRHRHLQHFVRRPARGLATLQGPQGSFGSLRSTALAMQALQDLEPDPAGKWNRTAASEWLLSKQRIDGGWSEEPIQDGQVSCALNNPSPFKHITPFFTGCFRRGWPHGGHHPGAGMEGPRSGPSTAVRSCDTRIVRQWVRKRWIQNR